ncbi:hypothetical protein IAU60_001773 [Kwoniella sp. DSM 27419]
MDTPTDTPNKPALGKLHINSLVIRPLAPSGLLTPLTTGSGEASLLTPAPSPNIDLSSPTSLAPAQLDFTPHSAIAQEGQDTTLANSAENNPLLDPPPSPSDTSLEAPLRAHLSLLHPSTPPPIISFCATRLLSKDRPYGYQGDSWVPVQMQEIRNEAGAFDLLMAGVDIGGEKGQREGRKGQMVNSTDEAAKVLEAMYAAARESWIKLERMSPGSGGAL